MVFKLDSDGNESVLYAFGGGADGANPWAGLIRDATGNLYGTTIFGGNNSNSCPFAGSGCGVVFKVDSSGKETVLYTFTGGADGALPQAGLLAYQGALYGTTYGGGAYGYGVVFKLQ